MKTLKKIIAVSITGLFLTGGTNFALAGEETTGGASNAVMTLIQAEPDGLAGDRLVTGLDSKVRCTIIYASDSTMALAGNNEDWNNPFPIIWFQPAEDEKFGYMGFGFPGGWPKEAGFQREGAVNEKGLFYDFAAAEEVSVPHDPNKRDCDKLLTTKIMEECSTVDEAIQKFSEYNFKLSTMIS